MPTKVSVAAGVERELLTADDFRVWLVPGCHTDLIDGEGSLHTPVSLKHVNLLNFLDRLMAAYIELLDLGVLYREVVAVRLSPRNVFLPDLAFYRKERHTSLRESYADGAPDLVVEALSRHTTDRDIGPKFAEYEQHGVYEYWILDPKTLAHRFYRL